MCTAYERKLFRESSFLLKSQPTSSFLQLHIQAVPALPQEEAKNGQNYQTTQKWTKNYTVLEPKPGVKESAQHMKLCNICGAVVQQACTHLSNTNFPKEFCCTLCEAVFKHRETYESHVMEHEHGKRLVRQDDELVMQRKGHEGRHFVAA